MSQAASSADIVVVAVKPGRTLAAGIVLIPVLVAFVGASILGNPGGGNCRRGLCIIELIPGGIQVFFGLCALWLVALIILGVRSARLGYFARCDRDGIEVLTVSGRRRLNWGDLKAIRLGPMDGQSWIDFIPMRPTWLQSRLVKNGALRVGAVRGIPLEVAKILQVVQHFRPGVPTKPHWAG